MYLVFGTGGMETDMASATARGGAPLASNSDSKWQRSGGLGVVDLGEQAMANSTGGAKGPRDDGDIGGEILAVAALWFLDADGAPVDF